MKRLTTLKIITALGAGGTLFAGYLSFYKAITGTCALGESCPIVLGVPACVYGFVLFLSMTSVAAYTVFAKVEDIWPEQVLQTVAVVGSLYAGWLSMQDIGPWLESGGSYQLYLPSCVYGLAFYLVIFALSSKLVSAAKRAARGEPAATAPVETVRDNGDASVEK